MGKKRRQEQQAHDLSSSDAKPCRSCQNGEIVRPSDRMPLDGSSDVFASIRDIRQDKVRMEEKLERKIVKLEKKREKDKNKYKEDLNVLKEDLKKVTEVTEELRKNQEEMRKEGCAKVHHCSASASQRSQQQSQTTRFRLEIKSQVNDTVYKGEPIRTNDGDCIEVVMYDGGNPIASGHPLSSITVQLVVVQGRFNGYYRNFWSQEEFENSIRLPREGNRWLVKNDKFKLTDGRHVHKGAIITENSDRQDFALGVMVGEYIEGRVQEGVSNRFRVQEAKTKKRGKGKESATGDTAEDKQLSPIAPMLNSSCLITSHIEGNGQALNGNSQQHFPKVLTGISSHPTSTQATQNGSVSWREQQSLPPPTVQTAYATAANGNGPAGQLPLDRGQQECISSSNASAYLEIPYLNLQGDPFLSWPLEGYLPPAGDVNHLDAQTQDGPYICHQVLLLWDKPDLELRQRCSLLDKLMPLYTRQSSICSRSSPSMSLMHKVHALLASSSPDDSVVKMMRNLGLTSVTGRAMQTPQKRGILIQPIEPYDPDDEPPVKEQRHANYQLRFVNRACNDYYTSEQIKSDDGNLLKVALYDGNNMRITVGLLSSASVEVVLLHGDFNADDQDCWTSEEFNSCILCPQSGKEQPAMGGDRVLVLIDGEGNLSNVNFQKTSFHARTGKFKMGVRMIVNLEERVQEGITEPFIVRNRPGGGSNINSASRLGESPMALRELPKECTTHERDGIFPLQDLSRCHKDEKKFCELLDLEKIKAPLNQKLSSRENKTMTILSKDAPAEIAHPTHPEHKLKLLSGDVKFECNRDHDPPKSSRGGRGVRD